MYRVKGKEKAYLVRIEGEAYLGHIFAGTDQTNYRARRQENFLDIAAFWLAFGFSACKTISGISKLYISGIFNWAHPVRPNETGRFAGRKNE